MVDMTIRLTHSSNHPGAEGEPGDVITCPSDIASIFIAGRGAVIVEQEPKQKPVKKSPARKTSKQKTE